MFFAPHGLERSMNVGGDSLQECLGSKLFTKDLKQFRFSALLLLKGLKRASASTRKSRCSWS